MINRPSHTSVWGSTKMVDYLLTGQEARRRSRTRRSDLRLIRPVAGEVLDFSPLGLGIESADALRVGESYSLLLRRGMRRKRVTGRVAWCKLTKTELVGARTAQPFYRSGIEIDHLEPSAWRFLSSAVSDSPLSLPWP
jgi:hypothetical protein